jgi:hypothetical protein
MSNVKKLMMTAAGGGEALDINDVFSTYVYTGPTGVDNGVDLWNEGGMVWIKNRDTSEPHVIFDTERGARYHLATNSTTAQVYDTNTLTTFSSDGAGASGFFASQDAKTGQSGVNYCSWTFRKAPKFFDVVTYTGNGTNRTISHNLGSTPGCMIIKAYSGNYAWAVYHRGHPNPFSQYSWLQSTQAVASTVDYWNLTDPTDSEFSLGTNGAVNANGVNYVAYLFAHNDGDGDFGPTGDQDIIKCGSYTGSNSQELNIGFEPQWILIKRTSPAGNWMLYDNIRGMADAYQNHFRVHTTSAEFVGTNGSVLPTPQGLQFDTGTTTDINSGGDNFIYIAVRRGSLFPPTAASEVFDMATADGSGFAFSSNFPVDAATNVYLSGSWRHTMSSKLINKKYFRTDANNGASIDTAYRYDRQNEWYQNGLNADFMSHMWKRAPNFFDVVCYNGDGSAGRNINHSLGVAPEMMWVKRRQTGSWAVYHSGLDVDGDGLPETDDINLNTDAAATDQSLSWNDTAPTETHFTVGNGNEVNNTNGTYIAFLFASLDGISKVGSYTGNGTSQTIDCGFSSGASFVLITRTDSDDDWWVFDTERGIVAGTESGIMINNNSIQDTGSDYIDPHNSGFIINGSGGDVNYNGGSYIFYAIAAI